MKSIWCATSQDAQYPRVVSWWFIVREGDGDIPMVDGDTNEMEDDAIIVRWKQEQRPSTLHRNHHRHGWITTTATIQFPMTRGSKFRLPSNMITTTMIQQQPRKRCNRKCNSGGDIERGRSTSLPKATKSCQNPQLNAKLLRVGRSKCRCRKDKVTTSDDAKPKHHHHRLYQHHQRRRAHVP